ncbi:MAG TPA: hypothetical protein VK760_10165 [Candidatus Acidoferrales bacterium]|nr:hypothetical protein [Candidatus Acidoferrales bacterium]
MEPPTRTPAHPDSLLAELFSFSGPTETISASVPVLLVERVREKIGRREFSQFVSRSIQRELVRLYRLEFVAAIEAKSGTLDEQALDDARRMILE